MAKEFQIYEDKMQKSVKVMEQEFGSIRAGRASPSVLDKVEVDYYGVPTKITAMAAVSVSEARILVVQPWDKSTLKSIEKAIQSSDIGINPVNDGVSLKLIFPPLTEERRKEIVKQIQKLAEDTKVAIRSIRRDAIDTAKAQKKKSEITEDDLKKAEKDLQTMTDNYIKVIDKKRDEKEKEIMEV